MQDGANAVEIEASVAGGRPLVETREISFAATGDDALDPALASIRDELLATQPARRGSDLPDVAAPPAP
jgi:hypothetical protein